jgi:hypothetical protein
VISYKPRLQIEAWLVLPSKDALKAISIFNLVINQLKKCVSKSDSFCETQADCKAGCL